MTIRSDATAFEVKAIAALKAASDKLPLLDEIFPGSTQAAIDQIKARIEALTTEIEGIIAGWQEAVAQAAGGDQAGA